MNVSGIANVRDAQNEIAVRAVAGRDDFAVLARP